MGADGRLTVTTTWWSCPNCPATLASYVVLAEPPTHLCAHAPGRSRRQPLYFCTKDEWAAHRHGNSNKLDEGT